MNGGVDLNVGCRVVQTPGIFSGGYHEHWQGTFRPDDGFPALDNLH